MEYLSLFILGAIVGSFLGALTWRWPKDKSILDGRSVCPRCEHKIEWYDNIPLVSYLILKSRCRHCNKPISKRYFLIELSLALFFPVAYFLLPAASRNIAWLAELGGIGVPFVLTVSAALAAIFIIDAEHRYIPDSLVFIILGLTLLVFLATDYTKFYENLAAGAGAAVFLLSLNLITQGQGMGLGDVKLALALGAFLGFPLVLVWLPISFVLGATIGILAIAMRFARFKQKIPFGPFLIVGFVLTTLFGFQALEILGF